MKLQYDPFETIVSNFATVRCLIVYYKRLVEGSNIVRFTDFLGVSVA